MPKRPCARPGCPAIVVRGYCVDCTAKHGARSGEKQRLTSTQRGYGYRWQQTSSGFLKRNPFCRDIYHVHGDRLELSTQTDHIVPHRGDMKLFWDRGNWQPLCDSCHSRKTAYEDGGFGRKMGKPFRFNAMAGAGEFLKLARP